MDDVDIDVWQFGRGVQIRNLRIVPQRDLAKINVGDDFSGKFEIVNASGRL